MINEHDITKKMLGKIRNIVTEQTNNGINLKETNKGEFDSEMKKFTETIDPMAYFYDFMIYPNDRNVIVGGMLSNDIEFVMSLKQDSGLTIKTSDNNFIKVDNDVIKMLTRLNGYYTNWVKEWATKLKEYGTN